jgi:hypothetical protein
MLRDMGDAGETGHQFVRAHPMLSALCHGGDILPKLFATFCP